MELKKIVISAEFVTNSVGAYGIHVMTIFNPTDQTRSQLENIGHTLNEGDSVTLHGVIIQDQYDDGREDVHSTTKWFRVIKFGPQSPGKTKAVVMILEQI